MRIGQFQLHRPVALAPMAGISDLPFRRLCRRLGADLTPAEMIHADVGLWNTQKTRRRLAHDGEPGPVIIQIAGGDPTTLANAAQAAADRGADIVDINMGCPAKKVCKQRAGSQLLRDPDLVSRLLDTVVAAVNVPVTLKMRTGWSPEQRNGVLIAEIAQRAGIAALTVHGRTRNCMFSGEAEYDTIKKIKTSVNIPVIANGDIDSSRKALRVLDYTGADGVMIGRAATGQPWLCGHVANFLRTGAQPAALSLSELRDIILDHLDSLYIFYGAFTGVRVARKHLSWYFQRQPNSRRLRERIVRVESAAEQIKYTLILFERLKEAAAP
jgi:tRNA-dihydrouridine synthase B